MFDLYDQGAARILPLYGQWGENRWIGRDLCPAIDTQGVVAPGHMMNQVIGEMKQAQVQYIIWSNRKFYEYGVPEFGVDFDTPLGEYIRTNYRAAREFGSNEMPDAWHASLWER